MRHKKDNKFKLYLLRHAIAVKRNARKYPNDDRPLDKEGLLKMKRAASGIKKICSGIDLLVASPMQRSFQTAKIVKASIKYRKKIFIEKSFLPGSSITGQLRSIKKLVEKHGTVMIIGHEPDLSQLLKRLVRLDDTNSNFEKGALALIMLGKSGKARLKFLIPPKVLENLRK